MPRLTSTCRTTRAPLSARKRSWLRSRPSEMRAILPFVFLAVAMGAGAAGTTRDMPAFTVERWVNSPALTPDMLRGKVVLVDVWEYTCINWIRTAPYVKAWHRDYADRGLVVVGLHAPEFEFGKRAEHIDRGIRDHGLTYPSPSTTILRRGGPSARTPVRRSTFSTPAEDW